MSEDHGSEPQITEDCARYVPVVKARMWLRRGAELGRLLKALSKRSAQFWRHFADRLTQTKQPPANPGRFT
jgi:hypothetical protein